MVDLYTAMLMDRRVFFLTLLKGRLEILERSTCGMSCVKRSTTWNSSPVRTHWYWIVFLGFFVVLLFIGGGYCLFFFFFWGIVDLLLRCFGILYFHFGLLYLETWQAMWRSSMYRTVGCCRYVYSIHATSGFIMIKLLCHLKTSSVQCWNTLTALRFCLLPAAVAACTLAVHYTPEG